MSSFPSRSCLLQLLQLLHGFLKIAVLQRLGHLVGRTLLEILELIELLLQLLRVSHSLAALLDLLGQVVKAHQRLLAIRLPLGKLLGAALQLVEHLLGILEALLAGFLALLQQLLAQGLARLLDLFLDQRGVLLGLGLRFDDSRRHEHGDQASDDNRRQRQQRCAPELQLETLGDVDLVDPMLSIGHQGFADRCFQLVRRESQGAGNSLLETEAAIHLDGRVDRRLPTGESPDQGEQQARAQPTGHPMPIGNACKLLWPELCGADAQGGDQQRDEPGPAQDAQEALKENPPLGATHLFAQTVHRSWLRRMFVRGS